MDTQYSAEAKTRVEDFLTKMEHVRLVVQNQDRITSEVASLESRASQRLLDVAAAIDADDDERGPGQHKRAKFPTSKAHISAVFHSFRLIFGRAIIPRNGLEA